MHEHDGFHKLFPQEAKDEFRTLTPISADRGLIAEAATARKSIPYAIGWKRGFVGQSPIKSSSSTSRALAIAASVATEPVRVARSICER